MLLGKIEVNDGMLCFSFTAYFMRKLDVPILINIGIIFFREKAVTHSNFQNLQISLRLWKIYQLHILMQTKY